MTIVIATVLFALTLHRFGNRFNEEVDRQRMLTWPRVPAIFDPKEPILLEPSIGARRGVKWFTRLAEPYRFYFNGELREGNNLIPEKIRLNNNDQQEIGRRLNRRREELTVRYNPEDFTENMLLVPHAGISWPRLAVYLFFGVVLPVVFIHFLLLPLITWETASYINAFN